MFEITDFVLQIIIYVLLGIIVAVSIAFIIVNAKNKTKVTILTGEKDALSNEVERKKREIAGQEDLIKSQEHAYNILSDTNTGLMAEIEETKVAADAIKQRNSELSHEITVLSSKVQDLETQVKVKENENEILKNLAAKKPAETKATKSESKSNKETVKEVTKDENLEVLKREELLELARTRGLTGISKKSKADLIDLLRK